MQSTEVPCSACPAQVLADAVAAQAELKEKVAAGNSWAETPYNDPEEFPSARLPTQLEQDGVVQGSSLGIG